MNHRPTSALLCAMLSHNQPQPSMWLPLQPRVPLLCSLDPATGRPVPFGHCFRPAVYMIGNGLGFPACGKCRLKARSNRFSLLGLPEPFRFTEDERLEGKAVYVQSETGEQYHEGEDYWFNWADGTIRPAQGGRIRPGATVQVGLVPKLLSAPQPELWVPGGPNRAERRRNGKARL